MENKLLLNMIEDRFRRFQKEYAIVTTDFYDLAQQSALSGFVREHSAEGAYFFGGYEEAERRLVTFMPDYLDVDGADTADDSSSTAGADAAAGGAAPLTADEKLLRYFRANPDDCPLAVLDVTIRQKGAQLRHSDYLGSMLALGVRREKTGDILVRPDGAHIFVMKELAPYLAENYTRAGRVPVEAGILEVSELVVTAPKTERIREPISSARLDNALTAAFGVSRKAAAEAIGRGLVFVNNVEAKKPDLHLKGGEKLVLRGKGKAVYRGSAGTSRKGKIYAEFDRYV